MIDALLTLEFNKPALRKSLTESRVSGQRVSGIIIASRGVPFFGRKGLKSWEREEFKLMITFVKLIDKLGLTYSEGNPFVQALNYCATLKNWRKCMVLELELVGPDLKRSFGMRLGAIRIKDVTDKTGNDETNKIY